MICYFYNQRVSLFCAPFYDGFLTRWKKHNQQLTHLLSIPFLIQLHNVDLMSFLTCGLVIAVI